MSSQSSALSPVAVFAYRRPEHLQRTLQALRLNPEAARTELFIFCDGAKDSSAAQGVNAVRNMVQGDLGFATTHIVTRDVNYGLAKNITEGVSEVLRLRDTVVVVEDDVIVSPFFLRFMNEALSCYRHNPLVGSISGYCYPLTEQMQETYFIRGSDCWGWATWRDRWKEYNPDGAALLRELKARDLCHAFDFDGTTGFVRMLEDQIAGRNNSWAVRWHASCFLRDLLILYPGRALAHNIGQDGSGTHTLSQDDTFNVTLSDTPVRVGGIAVQEDPIARDAICRYFRKRQSSGALSRKAFRDAVVRRLPRRVVHVLRLIRNWIRARQTFR